MMTPTLEAIEVWLVERLRVELGGRPVDLDRSLAEYGIDSRLALDLLGGLEDWLDLELDPALLFEQPSLAALAEQLQELAAIAHGG